MYGFLVGVLILDSLVLTTAILLQAGQGGGLASLGGGAGTEQFMGGRQATTLLTRLTWWSAAIFLFLSLVLAIMSAQTSAPRSVIDTTAPAPAPVLPTPLPLQSTPQQTPSPQPPPPPPANPSPSRRPPDR
jgi:preprotein translocase subunit SecG